MSEEDGSPASDEPSRDLAEDVQGQVPVYDIELGERYSKKEVESLRNRWSDEKVDEVVEWLNASTPKHSRPKWLKYVGTLGQKQWRGPDLRGIDLSGRGICAPAQDSPQVVLQGVHFEYAKLDRVDLRRADLTQAHFEHSDLGSAQLEGAALVGVHLRHANLSKANLKESVMESAHIWGANLSDVLLKETSFWNAEWRSAKGRKPDPRSFHGFDVRGIRYSDPLFDKWVRQSNSIHRVRERCPVFYWLWKVSCNCGRSFLLWVAWCVLLAGLFGLIYHGCHEWGWLGGEVVRLKAGYEPNLMTYMYFSVVTFTTLGFGDVTPVGHLGEVLVTIEVILGYVGLGGLISIFTTKLIPPR